MADTTANESFDDVDQLDKFMNDQKASDTVTVSTVADATDVVAAFRSSGTTSPWTSLSRSDVADRLAQLIDEPRQVRQGALNLCGPAAFFCQWVKRDPVAFSEYATALFDTGTGPIGSLQITPNQDLINANYADMLQRMGSDVSPRADWMILGSLRNSTDVFWQGSWKGDPDQQLAAMTRPEELASWFQATGIYGKVENQANWMTLAGIPHALSLRTFEGVDTSLLIHLNMINLNLLKLPRDRHPDTDWLMTQFPNHFVVLLNEVVQDVGTKDILLNIWTWGGPMALRLSQQDFQDNYYGAVVATMPGR